MRLIANVTGLNLDPTSSPRVTKDLFKDLRRIYPEGVHLQSFQCALPVDDNRFTAIVKCLAAAGLRPWVDVFRTRKPGEYSFVLVRTYDNQDLSDSDYLVPRPPDRIEGLDRAEDGLLKLNLETLTGTDFAYTDPFHFVVSPRLKRLIEESGLRGAKFRRTYLTNFRALVDGRLTNVRLPWHGHGEPFWELTSDLTMPPLAPSNTMFDNDGNPFSGDYANGCLLREGFYRPPELHYTSTDIAAAGSFDFALTKERFGIKPDEDERKLVTSRRFYDLCCAHKLESDWIPVRVDP